VALTEPAPLRVDTLITGATIVTMDAQRRVITDGAIGIAGDRIAVIGKTRDILPGIEAAETIDGRRFVMTPGFVNGHVHVTETLIKNYIPESAGFHDGVWKWSVPLYELQDAREQALAAQLAAVSMLRTGTTCFLEAGTVLALEPVFEALVRTGIRGRIGQWVMDRDFSGTEDQTAKTDKALHRLRQEMQRYPSRDDARVSAWPLLIGHTTCTDALWRGAKAMADSYGACISAHMSPVEADADWYVANTGHRPIAHLAELDVLGESLCLTHMVHVDAAELALLAQSNTRVIHCPGAALKGGFGLASQGKFPEMDAAGVVIMLGTDGADHADMMRAMNLVACVFKDARRDTSLFPATRAIEMATVQGAKALKMAHEIGSLAVGAKADLVLHDTERPEWTPMLNPVAQLVWSADGRGVHSVWVDGRRVVADYRCTMIDEAALFADCQAAASAITHRSGLPLVCPWPSL
jgi:5-methylthioadenosine/S-adenosylhomocysteine deaminase